MKKYESTKHFLKAKKQEDDEIAEAFRQLSIENSKRLLNGKRPRSFSRQQKIIEGRNFISFLSMQKILYQDIYLRLLRMRKDFILDHFKPYKSKAHRNRDFYFIFAGFKKVAISFLQCCLTVFSPLLFLATPFVNHKMQFMLQVIIMFVLWPFIGALTFTQGLLEIAFSPIALLRASWRSLLTKKAAALESSPSLQKLVTQEVDKKNSLQDTLAITSALSHKLEKAENNKQENHLPLEGLAEALNFSKAVKKLFIFADNNTLDDFVKEQQKAGSSYEKNFKNYRDLFAKGIEKYNLSSRKSP